MKKMPMLEQQTKNLTVELINDSAVIRFVRPEIKNPLSVETLEALNIILDDLESNKNLTKIIFTGSGDTFAAGANLREIAEITKDTAREFALRGQHLVNKISNSEHKTIAAINGFCFGGALDLAMACKMRIAAPDAIFCHPGVNLGIITGWGGTQLLPRLVGEANALEMLLTARKVDAKNALRVGLIDKITQNPLEESLNDI